MTVLVIDGVKYSEWKPEGPDAEEQMERLVVQHSKDIFGEDSEYFDTKMTLKSLSGIGSIPDGYAVVFRPSPEWHIVEVELSSHPVYEHIVSQVSKFIDAIQNGSSQRAIIAALHSQIDGNEALKLRVKNLAATSEIHKFLSDLIAQPPTVTVIVEKQTDGLTANSALVRLRAKVVEFRTFYREDAGRTVHAHVFEPLHEGSRPKPHGGDGGDGERTPTPPGGGSWRDLVRRGVVSPGQMLFREYKGKRYEAEVLPGGGIRLHDGVVKDSPSGAADHVTDSSTNGWIFWYALKGGQKVRLADLRGL